MTGWSFYYDSSQSHLVLRLGALLYSQNQLFSHTPPIPAHVYQGFQLFF